MSQIKLVNINATSIADGKPAIVLGLVWTIILHFQVGKKDSDLMQLIQIFIIIIIILKIFSCLAQEKSCIHYTGFYLFIFFFLCSGIRVYTVTQWPCSADRYSQYFILSQIFPSTNMRLSFFFSDNRFDWSDIFHCWLNYLCISVILTFWQHRHILQWYGEIFKKK